MSLNKEQKEYILKNKDKKKYTKIAKELDIEVKEIYKFTKKNKIFKNKPWTKKADESLLDAIGRKKTKIIAKDLDKSVSSICQRASYLNVSLNDPEAIFAYGISKKIGMSLNKTKSALKNCTLKNYGKYKFGKAGFIIDIDDYFDWVFEKHPFAHLKCYECEKDIVGSMYCFEHTPEHKKKLKPLFLNDYFVDSRYYDLNQNILNTFKKIRKLNNINQSKISYVCGYYKDWYFHFEKNNKKNISLYNMYIISKAIGYNMCLSIRDYEDKFVSEYKFNENNFDKYGNELKKIRLNSCDLNEYELGELIKGKNYVWLYKLENNISSVYIDDVVSFVNQFNMNFKIRFSLNEKRKREIIKKNGYIY